ncbi:MAG: hypothetical protein NVSMB52_02310 [Chloroflexota bacterium]
MVTLCDLTDVPLLVDAVRKVSAHWIGYFPLEAGPVPDSSRPLLAEMQRRVTTSAFSAGVFRASVTELSIDVIQHGVDTSVFNPEGESQRPLLPSGDGAFVFGCVARNQPRKGLPVLIEAFALFAERHRDAVLHLHTMPQDPHGYDLFELVRRYGIEGKTRFTPASLDFRGISDSDLAKIYRSFDVFVLPTFGEGFGLPLLEAMACGIPVIASEGSAVTELVEGRGELVPATFKLCAAPYGQEYFMPNAKGLLEAMERLYADPLRRRELARRGAEFATTLTWDRAAEQWLKMLQEVMAEPMQRRYRTSPGGQMGRPQRSNAPEPVVPLIL